jgi:hypothetical protein
MFALDWSFLCVIDLPTNPLGPSIEEPDFFVASSCDYAYADRQGQRELGTEEDRLMNALRTLFLLALTASLPLAPATAQTVSKVTVFDHILGATTSQGGRDPNQFSSGFPMEVRFEGYAENLDAAPHANNFIVELFTDTPGSLVRHVFPLPPANDTGDRVVVPISVTYSFPTTVDHIYTRVLRDGPADRITIGEN